MFCATTHAHRIPIYENLRSSSATTWATTVNWILADEGRGTRANRRRRRRARSRNSVWRHSTADADWPLWMRDATTSIGLLSAAPTAPQCRRRQGDPRARGRRAPRRGRAARRWRRRAVDRSAPPSSPAAPPSPAPVEPAHALLAQDDAELADRAPHALARLCLPQDFEPLGRRRPEERLRHPGAEAERQAPRRGVGAAVDAGAVDRAPQRVKHAEAHRRLARRLDHEGPEAVVQPRRAVGAHDRLRARERPRVLLEVHLCFHRVERHRDARVEGAGDRAARKPGEAFRGGLPRGWDHPARRRRGDARGRGRSGGGHRRDDSKNVDGGRGSHPFAVEV